MSTCVFFLPSSVVTLQFSQAPQTTNPSTSACTEKQQPTAAILKGKERITPHQTVAYTRDENTFDRF